VILIKHTEDHYGKIVIVEPHGALDNETSPDFEEYINQLIDSDKIFIIINAMKLEYISSTGIAVILYIHKKISTNNGLLVISNLSDEIMNLFKLLSFDKIIRITKKKDEAIQIIEKHFEINDSSFNEIPDEIKEENLETVKIYSIEEFTNSENKDITPTSKNMQEENKFDNPIIIECTECKGLVRVRESGNYLCPECDSEFTVDQDKNIVF